jgi:hypothetical protein
MIFAQIVLGLITKVQFAEDSTKKTLMLQRSSSTIRRVQIVAFAQPRKVDANTSLVVGVVATGAGFAVA